jgi:hypothetical protein
MFPRCRQCKKTFEIVVPDEAYQRWEDGELIQKALPMLTAGERELLINGICESCFDKLFKALDEEK